jgi:GT2 family glycosyltransferase
MLDNKSHMLPNSIDVIVPVYKNVDLAARCLTSLVEHFHEIADRDPRLIIINDSPEDNDLRRMLKFFADRHKNTRLVENEHNVGFVHSSNRGLSISRAERRDVILVNADTETFPETLRSLAIVAYADSQIGFVSPRSNNASFCSLPHFYGGTLPDPTEAFHRWQLLSRTMPAFHFVPTAVGFYLYIRHPVLANFGLLDEAFGIGYEEENDLVLRANKVGYRAVLANKAFAYHAGSASFSLLANLNLSAQRDGNLHRIARRHPEYLELVRRYEASPHFRAERLLGSLIPTAAGRLKLVFDLSGVGPDFNGTNEMSVAIVDGFCGRHGATFDLHVICSMEAFRFHRLDRHENLQRHEVDLQTSERFAIGVQLGQPFTLHAISTLEDLAAVNVFGMLDTIAEDCGYLSVTHRLEHLWTHVARHASGVFFNSAFSERTFLARYPDANALPRYARLLPTRLNSYKARGQVANGDHVLIIGNHFSHKASDSTAALLGSAFPTVQFVVLGRQHGVSRNVRSYRAGSVSAKTMEALYSGASVVVLPSHVEGFGFGVVHALAARKALVARDIPATREILATYGRYTGVFLYSDDSELETALRKAMNAGGSTVDESTAEGWEQWVDGFASFCRGLIERDDVFEQLRRRIEAGDRLRIADRYEQLQSPDIANADTEKAAARESTDAVGKRRQIRDARGREWYPLSHVGRLLDMEGEDFVYGSYVTILNRLPDPEGLTNYMSELHSGVSKLEIISRLRNSTEGRRARMPLGGYRSILVKTRLRSLLGMSLNRAPRTT